MDLPPLKLASRSDVPLGQGTSPEESAAAPQGCAGLSSRGVEFKPDEATEIDVGVTCPPVHRLIQTLQGAVWRCHR